MSHKNRIENGVLLESEVVLCKHAHSFALTLCDCTFVGLQFSAQQFKKTRFACPVGSYYPVAITGVELHIDFLKQNSLAELQFQIVYIYHCRDFCAKKNKAARLCQPCLYPQ